MINLTLYNIAICAVVSLGGFSYGFGYAVIIILVGQAGFYEYFQLDPTSSYTASILGAANALFAAGAAVGAIAQGWTADWLGRRLSILVAAVITLLGAAISSGSVHIAMFIVFRLVHGLGLGMIICLVPLYISEVAPPHRRGALSGMTVMGLVLGYLICSFVGIAAYYSTNPILAWRLPLALACVGPVALLVGIFYIPETPRYLVWINKDVEAWAILRKLHHDPNDATESGARAEFIQITKQVELDKQLKTGYIRMFTKASWRGRSLRVLFLMFASQSTGVLGITNYTVIIYASLGLTKEMPLVMYSIYTLVGTIFSFIGALIMDKFGRKRLLLIGFPLLSIILLAEAVLQSQFLGSNSNAGLAACVLFMFLFIFVYALFLEAPCIVWCSEIFPTTIRAKGIGLTFFSYFVGAITYTTPAPTAFRVIQWRMYFVWMACSILSTVLVYFFLPETARMPMEEIGALFGDEVVVHLTADGHGIVEKGLIDALDLPGTKSIELAGAAETMETAEAK